MKVTYSDWKQHRRNLLSVQIAALERYEAGPAPTGGSPGTSPRTPPPPQTGAREERPTCGMKPLGGTVDTRPRAREQWDTVRLMCHALAAARSPRWHWVGPRRLIILTPGETSDAPADGSPAMPQRGQPRPLPR